MCHCIRSNWNKLARDPSFLSDFASSWRMSITSSVPECHFSHLHFSQNTCLSHFLIQLSLFSIHLYLYLYLFIVFYESHLFTPPFPHTDVGTSPKGWTWDGGVRNNMHWMDNCIEAQWGLYIEYMRETLDYTITIIPLTIKTLTTPSNATWMQWRCIWRVHKTHTTKRNWYIRSPKSMMLKLATLERRWRRSPTQEGYAFTDSTWANTQVFMESRSTLQMRTLLLRDNNRWE
jgi:hypothetical protein